MICETTGQCTEDKLYYDINGLSTKILEWHGGQFTSTYKVGSSWFAGHGVEKKLLKECVDELDGCYEENDDEFDELGELIDMLNYQLNPY